MLAIEVVLLLWLMGSWLKGLIPPAIVALICFAVYQFASWSEPIRYRSRKHRKQATRVQRIIGGILGFVLGLGTIIASLSL